ncbi:hypothetical protein AeMF1_001992 [Aphanomyces euteiches]|nr:hypothetical protein AeMF1_001992 [Aphanomyces euteiches]KAH9190874.1 hypothetical protein AeNC1_007149 [Aphanomyces euteiches]
MRLVPWSWLLAVATSSSAPSQPSLMAGWTGYGLYDCSAACSLSESSPSCSSDVFYRRVIDAMVDQRYTKAGYSWLYIEDCWSQDTRDSFGRLQPHSQRFPHGFASLVDYAHHHGLLVALSIDLGPQTCHGLPGSWGHFGMDVHTIASWGVDRIVVETCSELPAPSTAYTMLSTLSSLIHQANLTSHCIVHPDLNATLVHAACDLVQRSPRVQDDWFDVSRQINDLLVHPTAEELIRGPLVVGGYGLTAGQARIQLAVWARHSFPLLLSVDLGMMDSSMKALVLNPFFLQAYRAKRIDTVEFQGKLPPNVLVWTQNVALVDMPALVLIAVRLENRPPHGPLLFDIAWDDLKLPLDSTCRVTNVWKNSTQLDVKRRTTLSIAPFDAEILVLACK